MLVLSKWIAGLAATVLVSTGAAAQVPSSVAAKLVALERRIQPLATAAIYAPLQSASLPRGVRIRRDVSYGPGDKEKFDLFTIAGRGRRPIVIFVHGGAFRVGDKNRWSDGTASPFYDNVMLWSAKHGMVGINMNYPLAPGATYPTVQRNIAQVVAWARLHATEIGGDPAQIVVWGHSAGASHVASFLAHPESYRDIAGAAAPVAAGVLFSGTYDMQGQTADHVYFGQASKLTERSSLEGLIASRVPLFSAAAELDPPSMVEQLRQLGRELTAARRRHVTLLAKDHEHMSETYAVNTSDVSVTNPLLRFLHALPGWKRQR